MVPRARLVEPDGTTREWKSAALRSYQRRTQAADALIASAYLAGTNTRRVRRALAAVFTDGIGKDTVSRVWRKVKTDWETWNRRDLAAEPIVRLILDGTVVRVRLDRKATTISLLVVIGVRDDGQKVLLAVKNMGEANQEPRRAKLDEVVRGGGETADAWRVVLDDLIGRGLRRPDLLIVDGGAGLDKALAAVWTDVPTQRCTVHTIRTQLRGGTDLADAVRLRGTHRDDMADLQGSVADDDAFDDELQDRLLVVECRGVQPGPNALAEGFQAGSDGLGLDPLAAQLIERLLLTFEELTRDGPPIAWTGV